MRPFFLIDWLQDLAARIARATAFANTDNLGDALRLMGEQHLSEVALRNSAAVRQAARRTMNRRQPALRRRDASLLPDQRAAQSTVPDKFVAVN